MWLAFLEFLASLVSVFSIFFNWRAELVPSEPMKVAISNPISVPYFPSIYPTSFAFSTEERLLSLKCLNSGQLALKSVWKPSALMLSKSSLRASVLLKSVSGARTLWLGLSPSAAGAATVSQSPASNARKGRLAAAYCSEFAPVGELPQRRFTKADPGASPRAQRSEFFTGGAGPRRVPG